MAGSHVDVMLAKWYQVDDHRQTMKESAEMEKARHGHRHRRVGRRMLDQTEHLFSLGSFMVSAFEEVTAL